jgi:hypothetical protein
LQAGFVHREGKAPMGRASGSHHIYAAVNNRQTKHQSMVVESSGTLNHINVKIYLIQVLQIVSFHLLH